MCIIHLGKSDTFLADWNAAHGNLQITEGVTLGVVTMLSITRVT